MRRNLEVTGISSPIIIAEGMALVHHKIVYWNTDREYMGIPTPVKDARIDCIVLRTDWTRQTVRLARIEGIEGEGPPMLAEGIRDGVEDAPLAQCSIMPDGAIDIIDVWADIEVAEPLDFSGQSMV